MDRKFKKYASIILLILGTIYCRFVYYPAKPFFGIPNRDTTMLLTEYDFTGMTKIFLNIITILNLIILIFYLYLLIREQNLNFFCKIFTIFSAILIFFSLISFTIIRNEEEKIAKELANKVYSIEEKLKKVQTIEKRNYILNDWYELQQDKFYIVKLRIVNEIESESTIWRYLYLYFFSFELEPETVYYNMFSRFALLDVLMFIYFFKNMRSNDLEEKVILNLFRRNKS